MKLQLLRNATLALTVDGKSSLIDPMLSPKGSFDAAPDSGNTFRNPLVDLPLNHKELENLITTTDAVLLTHIHPDHWTWLLSKCCERMSRFSVSQRILKP